MNLARAVGIAWLALAACGPARPSDRVGAREPAGRIAPQPAPQELQLSDAVQPTAYRLELTVDPDQARFSGAIEIDVALREDTSTIWLHGVDLAVFETDVRIGAAWRAATVIPGPRDSELIGVDLGQRVPAGAATIRMRYRAGFGTRVGLFRQRYGDHWYAYTDFEATDARRAMPCFDEPRHKVPWTVAVIAPDGHRAFGNMPVAREQAVADGRTRVQFETTRPLPSYLVAVAVGPFDVVDGPTIPTPMRMLVPRGQSEHARYAIDTMGPQLRWLETYFDMPVPYPKTDFVVVPDMSGAMENPGLITIGAAIALLDDDAPIERKRLLAMVIAHELAHLWFGDLVTPRWWDDLWLNEGFATWMADKVVRAHRPAWQWELEAFGSMGDAMAVDSAPDARAIRQSIRSLEDIRQLFSPITYKKAGAVLGMFEAWMGPERFRDGVRAYVKKHADGNANAADLVASLAAASGRDDVEEAFETFLLAPGVPIVDVQLQCDAGGARVALEQARYRRVGDRVDDSGAGPWRIPMCVRHELGRDCGVLTRPTGTLALTTKRCPAWFHPNADESGYYRYRYAPGAMVRASNEVERAGLAANARAGLDSGAIAVSDAVAIFARVAPAANYQAAAELAHGLRDLMWNAVPADHQARFGDIVRGIAGPRARALGLLARARDTDDDTFARATWLELAADEGGDAVLRADARTHAIRWLDTRADIDANTLRLILAIAAIDGDLDLAKRYLDSLAHTDDERARDAVLRGLGRFARPTVIAHVLAHAFDHLGIRERLTILRYAAEYPRTRDAAFAFLDARLDAIANSVPLRLRPLLPLFAAQVCTPAQRARLTALFADRPVDPAAMNNTLATIDRCNAYRATHKTAAAAYAATAAGN